MASKWRSNLQNHLIADLNPKLGSSKQARDLQNAESVMGQAMEQQDNHRSLWERQTIIQEIILKMIFPWNNILDIGSQTQPLSTFRKFKDLQIPRLSPPYLQSHGSGGTDLLQQKYKPASVTPTGQSETKPAQRFEFQQRAKSSMTNQSRAHPADLTAQGTPYFTECWIPEPQLKAVGRGWTRDLHPPLSCTGWDLYPNFFPLKFSKILPWRIEMSLEQIFYKENYTFLRVSIFHWKPFYLIIKLIII